MWNLATHHGYVMRGTETLNHVANKEEHPDTSFHKPTCSQLCGFLISERLTERHCTLEFHALHP